MTDAERLDIISKLHRRTRQLLENIGRLETEQYGVIVSYREADALRSRGWATFGERRPYARITGVCVRLSDEGKKMAALLQNPA